MMFLLLAMVMQVALDASLAAEGRYRPITTAVKLPVASIPDCNYDLYIHERSCVTLIFTPNTSSVVQVRGREGRREGKGARGLLVSAAKCRTCRRAHAPPARAHARPTPRTNAPPAQPRRTSSSGFE